LILKELVANIGESPEFALNLKKYHDLRVAKKSIKEALDAFPVAA
jgi:plasmid maintenance system antidote protein VapI